MAQENLSHDISAGEPTGAGIVENCLFQLSINRQAEIRPFREFHVVLHVP